jgi:hypothetical protein
MTAKLLCRVAHVENDLCTPHNVLRMLVLAVVIAVAAVIFARGIAWM